MKRNWLFFVLSAVSIIIQLQFSCPAFGQEDEDNDNEFLLMYFSEDNLFVESSTRGRKSLTRAAENITVIDAREIQLMNAHTLADVLNIVMGVQVFMTGGPGSIAMVMVQSSENRHVSVFIDGIPVNNMSDTVAEIGAFPVQSIARIEIVKGPASSAWGSALGGAINVITKSGSVDESRGMVSASAGRSRTGDFRAEASGKEERLSYYASAGRLRSDGFRRYNDIDSSNAFVKFTFDITNSTQALLSTGYDSVDRGVADIPESDLFINNNTRLTRSTFSLQSVVNKETDFSLGFWRLRQAYDFFNHQASTGSQLTHDFYKETGYGANAKLSWKPRQHNLVLGTDIDSRKLESNTLADRERFQRKYALYLNDTITIDNFSVTPGIRRDETGTNGDFNSPSIGMTYKPVDTILLRAYAARGFNLPLLSATFGSSRFTVANPDLDMERVKSYQAGMETTTLPFLWLKLGVYRHDVSEMIVSKTLPGPQFMAVNDGKARRQGLEVEMRSKPVKGAFLSAGAAFMNTRDAETGRTVPNTPQRTYDIGVHYDDASSNALVTGHYVFWNSDVFAEGKFKAMIFDIHMAHNIYSASNKKIEVFFNIHNIFNGDQYAIVLYKNPGRWSEAGLRFIF